MELVQAIADAHTVQSLSDAIVFCYWYAENIGLTCHKVSVGSFWSVLALSLVTRKEFFAQQS